MINLEICKNNYATATNIESDVSVPINICNVWIEKNHCVKLSDCNALKELAQKCHSMTFALKNEKTEDRIEIPQSISRNLLRFIQEGRPSEKFCCVDFINYLFGKHDKLNYYDTRQWNCKLFDTRKLSPSTVVLLYKKNTSLILRIFGILCSFLAWLYCLVFHREKKFSFEDVNYFSARRVQHFAIYLGFGIYLSLFGTTGPLICTSLEAMKKLFDADSAIILKPIQIRSSAICIPR